jgi:hypothetical protein
MTHRDAYIAYSQYIRIARQTGNGINPNGIDHTTALKNYSAAIAGNETVAESIEDVCDAYNAQYSALSLHPDPLSTPAHEYYLMVDGTHRRAGRPLRPLCNRV